MLWPLYVLTIVAGLLNPVASGLAGTLEKTLERPFLVAAVSLALSLLCAVAGGLFTGQLGWPPEKAAEVPWWAWLGGLAGFAVFIARPYAAQPLGAAAFTGLTVTASVVFSLLLDHYGLLGFQQHDAGWGRIAGAALMCAGVALVALT
ncbi:DMT family transporter [Craurococcus roseus]|uniref:DMT family transporter n=1 Tax=Craurococcus roseus TaxID=77585 RepID=A0ABN1EUB4_9PROT